MNLERIDALMVKKGISKSRAKAKEYIELGYVFVDNKKVNKSSLKIPFDTNIEIKGKTNEYVSRGGLKLNKALDEFNINVKDKVALDIGASTGGFTDCLLKRGVKKVYAVDVGYDQLCDKLKKDSRVVSMEKTNVRYIKPDDIGQEAQFACIDVSFISLKLILPVIKNLVSKYADIVALVKPQFEAGKDRIGKKGIVKDSKIHKEILIELYEFCKQNKLFFINLTFSPFKGKSGNIEYLVHISQKPKIEIKMRELIDNTVKNSHNIL